MNGAATRIAILGLGEAGSAYARGLRDAGADVRAYDPFRRLDEPDVRQIDGLADAVEGADAVLSLVGAASALPVAEAALREASESTVYADLNTAAPDVKHEIARLAAARRIAMADVAVLAPVSRAGHRTELLASGPGAGALAGLLSPLGVPVTAIAGEPGDAARLRLLRSVFMKGLAALVIEGVGAARAVDAGEWLRDQMAGEFGLDGRGLIDRLIDGTHRHALRREHEMRDALAVLEATGQPADMTRATLAWFQRLVAERDAD